MSFATATCHSILKHILFFGVLSSPERSNPGRAARWASDIAPGQGWQQGKSGLGIEAQRATLARFAEVEGFQIVAEYVEVETGKGSDAIDRRPQLAAALARLVAERGDAAIRAASK